MRVLDPVCLLVVVHVDDFKRTRGSSRVFIFPVKRNPSSPGDTRDEEALSAVFRLVMSSSGRGRVGAAPLREYTPWVGLELAPSVGLKVTAWVVTCF